MKIMESNRLIENLKSVISKNKTELNQKNDEIKKIEEIEKLKNTDIGKKLSSRIKDTVSVGYAFEILDLLSNNSQMSSAEIREGLGLSQSTGTFHQILSVLVELGLVTFEMDKRVRKFSLA